MKKKLFLHIGCGKTGSSALQLWLNQNSQLLHKNGYYYPIFNIKIEDAYQITSGNGTHLVNALKNHSVKEFLSDIVNPKENKIVFSSEAFQRLNETEIKELKNSAEEIGFDIEIIAYVRNLYEMAYSSYMQLVKRHGYSESLDFYLSRINSFQQFNVVDLWSSIFEQITVLHYDTEKENLDLSFLKVIDFSEDQIPRMKKNKVNRSLTLLESELIKTLNKNIKYKFDLNPEQIGVYISDNLIKQNPELETHIFYDESIIDELYKKFNDKVIEYNKKYFKNNEVLKISSTHENQIKTIKLSETEETIGSIMNLFFEKIKKIEIDNMGVNIKNDSALDIKDRRIVDCLRNEAIRLESNDLNRALILMQAAEQLRPDGQVILSKISKYKERIKLEEDK